jgi:tyrosine-protein phosphatase SIW14
MNVPGIDNFGKVSDFLYRGAQPDAEGFMYLKSLGVKICVDLRSPYPQSVKESVLCELSGVEYRHLYWRAEPWFSVPDAQDVKDFIAIVRQNPGMKIFVHCRQGSDRTGVCVASYRIVVDGWTPQKAGDEMDGYGYHWYLFPRWKRWVESLTPEALDVRN